MERLLTFADYDNPYLTMTLISKARPSKSSRISSHRAWSTGISSRCTGRSRIRPHWRRPNSNTWIVRILRSTSNSRPGIAEAVGAAFGVELDQTPSFMIWTTTPWTLIANLMIAVHERFDYVLARIDGSETVIARSFWRPSPPRRAPTRWKSSVNVAGRASGSDLPPSALRADRTHRRRRLRHPGRRHRSGAHRTRAWRG